MGVPHGFLMDDLRRGYLDGRFTPVDVMAEALERAERAPDLSIWIARRDREEILAEARALAGRRIDQLPLYGVPFAIKDNIDLEGLPTTAGCPDYAYQPARSATVVQRLIDAGAIALGKTNLDQFATGLVGARSPYGAGRNAFRASFISGGSSSGSALAVALGLVTFSLGTDTAGSGRVPAAFNNLIGLKPSLGALSTRGVVPACRTLDCVSIFSLTAEDAAAVWTVAAGYDADDPYSRPLTEQPLAGSRVGIPEPHQLEFFSDREYELLFEQAITRIESLGATLVRIDFAPFLEAARLLYEGPWVAERYAAVEEFMRDRPQALHPVTRQVIEQSSRFSAVDAFKAQYRLRAFARAAESTWNTADLLITPTAGTIYEIAAVEADPIRLNTRLGYYTNFMNLLDLAGVAVPAGFRPDGLPFGITLVGPRGTDRELLHWAGRLQRAAGDRLGAMPAAAREPPLAQAREPARAGARLHIAVCGAHMEGLPLNHQLLTRGGRLVRAARTAASYRLLALPGEPARPGLVRSARGGRSIEIEVWAIDAAEVGSLLETVPPPLGLGKVELEDGERVVGFICEGHAAETAADITQFGGWRAYLRSRR